MQSIALEMTPRPGERLCRFVGDRVQFRLDDRSGRQPPAGWRALLRTNLGRADELRREILEAHTRGLTPAGGSWRDISMGRDEKGWCLELPLAQVGYFKAKAYAMDTRGWQHWPEGDDLGISVHPDKYRTANTLYCAFTRLFGQTAAVRGSAEKQALPPLSALDVAGYSVIPPSGKLRDLTEQLPHIVERLGCRILHLLPVHPTPTTYARFGRFGSPYAALDLTAIDPALVVFDKRSTGIDQFRELTYTAHLHGAAVFLDIVINHTGWGSVLQEHHPEWFMRGADQAFVSPGAWGTTWEDLVELKHENVGLWDKLAEILLTWCRRGVDGFRCDAGYKVPVAAWQYIVARVQQEFPETIFLLEGLGGAWETTEALLTEGGMQWAYSELFQNYSGPEIAGYLDHCLRQTARVGLLVHYSETHDNARLAARGRSWSLLRNRLCALTSVGGGFGFTCGVEWLAPEKIRVHERTPLNWDGTENLVAELARLSQLLADHPCFFEGARMIRISPVDSPIYALVRESEDGRDQVLVLVNTSVEKPAALGLTPEVASPSSSALQTAPTQEPKQVLPAIGMAGIPQGIVKLAQLVPDLTRWMDLLGQTAPGVEQLADGTLVFNLRPGAAYCLSPSAVPRGLRGADYRRSRAQAAWALRAMSELLPAESIPRFDWQDLARAVHQRPERVLAGLSSFGQHVFPADFLDQLRKPDHSFGFPRVVLWTLLDLRRVTLVPPNHWLLLQDTVRFRATLSAQGAGKAENMESIPTADGHVAFFAPRQVPAEASLLVERYTKTDPQVTASIRFLGPKPGAGPASEVLRPDELHPNDLVLLTNGRGGMSRLCIDLGRVNSKYDCVLAANLHPDLPVDRHVLAKRIRVWVNADGFISPLDFRNLRCFDAGPPAIWEFVANAGDGRTVELQVAAAMIENHNTTVFWFERPTAAQASGKQLPDTADVRLTVRVDIEDRNFHSETKRNGGAEHHFSTHTRALPGDAKHARPINSGDLDPASEPNSERFVGFTFTPAADRNLRAFTSHGLYHPQPEWSENIPHPIEQSRGQTGSGDAFSPGWFELPLAKGEAARLVITADPSDPAPGLLDLARNRLAPVSLAAGSGNQEDPNSARTMVPTLVRDKVDGFYERLLSAVRAFVVTRGGGKTVIAGYPWFLDWGRDTFICARGLLAAGMTEEVKQLLLTFARFEMNGTLPNTIFGEDASNRDTSDAPLWFGLVCEELKADLEALSPVPGRSVGDVLESIALNYIKGTPNGIRMDAASGLIWSPSHFTWMDTNYPACTPREGYPVEIQALWIRLLRQLAVLSKGKERGDWENLAVQAQASLEKFFWREDQGYYADVLLAPHAQPAAEALVDNSLRGNCLLVVSLGLSTDERARRCVDAALRYLVIPGALRSLAPLPVSVPLPNRGNDGQLLNDPKAPFWGRYEGDEDTRRKPAYHNGTAWTWTFPIFCEALARAWNFAPAATAAARAYLGSIEALMAEGCLGHLPEILDGDAPHTQRGCDAQAWGATEALRVWRLLQ